MDRSELSDRSIVVRRRSPVELRDQLKEGYRWLEATGDEYVLLKEVDDTPEDARRPVRWCTASART
ncbi:MAG: hypothetical protein HYS05_14530 [Acidobacteria bacterium]|nr:hypothetical protein [Acidobacteriota bacterium]